MNQREITETERLDYVLDHCQISSEYAVGLRQRKYTRADLDAFIEADELLQCVKDKERDKALELQQTLKENQENY